MKLENELADYLNKKEFKRFIDAWISKYKSLGHLGGRIIIDNLSVKEAEMLGIFLGLDLSNQTLSLSYNQFIKILNTTKYENINFLAVLNILNGQKIISHQQQKEEHLKNKENFIKDLKKIFLHTAAITFINDYINNDLYLNSRINNEYDYYFDSLVNIGYAYNSFPCYDNKVELLAVFSQRITKDPHYFDDDFHRELLLKSICFYLGHESLGNDSIERTMLLYKVGILRDELSNYCHICHIMPLDEKNTWKLFCEEYEPWNMNLYNLNKINQGFYFQNIYIFENPSVFYELSKYIKEKEIDVGLICSNGQINLCTYLLLDKLIDSGCHLYYAGDFDPEGLLIADKLKRKYDKSISFIGYELQCFNKIKVKTNISVKRQQMLKQIDDSTLKEIANLIYKTQTCGYQEGLIDEYKKEIQQSDKINE